MKPNAKPYTGIFEGLEFEIINKSERNRRGLTVYTRGTLFPDSGRTVIQISSGFDGREVILDIVILCGVGLYFILKSETSDFWNTVVVLVLVSIFFILSSIGIFIACAKKNIGFVRQIIEAENDFNLQEI